MERKNTMLLTVIAVATLLVAVVGATFAYFTATGDSSAASQVTVTTETNSSATVSSKGATISLSSAEMDESVSGTSYTVSDTADTNDTDGYLAFSVENKSTTSSYVCTFDLTSTATGYSGAAEDISVSITPATTNTTSDSGIVSYTKSFVDLVSSETLGQSLTFTVAPSTTATINYAIAITVTNTTSDQTTALAGKSLTTTVTASNLVCEHK